MDDKRYSFDDHPEHRKQVGPWMQKWVANAMSTEPADREKMTEAMAGLYSSAGYEPPPIERCSFVKSPVTAAISASIASGAWWIREHKGRHEDLFGRDVSELELIAAVVMACVHAVVHGIDGEGLGGGTDESEALGESAQVRRGMLAVFVDTKFATEEVTDNLAKTISISLEPRATRTTDLSDAVLDTVNSSLSASVSNAVRLKVDTIRGEVSWDTMNAVEKTAERRFYGAAGNIIDDAEDVMRGLSDSSHKAIDDVVDVISYDEVPEWAWDLYGKVVGQSFLDDIEWEVSTIPEIPVIGTVRGAIEAAVGAVANHDLSVSGHQIRADISWDVDQETRIEVRDNSDVGLNQSLNFIFGTVLRPPSMVVPSPTLEGPVKVLNDPAMTKLVSFLVRCTSYWWRMHNGGSDRSSGPAYLSFFRHVADLDLPIYEKWQHYENAALYGASRMMHPKFWIVSDRHTEIHLDRNNELHCEDGPARKWGDGWAIWSWRGTQVPRSLIERGWTIEEIMAEENAEIRRCAVEIMGVEEFEKHLTLVAEVPDPGNPGHTLKLMDLPEKLRDLHQDPSRILLCTNGTPERDGTLRRFQIPVPAFHTDPIEAMASTYDDEDSPVRMTPEMYARIPRRT